MGILVFSKSKKQGGTTP